MQQRQKLPSFIRLISQNSCEGWLKARQIMNQVLTKESAIPAFFESQIKKNINKITNFLSLAYVYSLEFKFDYGSVTPFREQYETIKRQDICFDIVIQWYRQQKPQIQVDTQELMLQYFSALIQRQLTQAKSQDIHFLFLFLHWFKVRRQREVNILVAFMRNLQQMRVSYKQYQNKELILLRLVCQVIERQGAGEGNLGMIIDQNLIGHQNEKHIDKFCSLRQYYITQLDEDILLNVFRQLSRGGINQTILLFFIKISRVLSFDEQFYKLCHIYQNFILSEVAFRMKTCNRPNVGQLTLQLTQYYVIGFMTHCNIGIDGIRCLLESVDKVKSSDHRRRWLDLASQAAIRGELQNELNKILKDSNIKKQPSGSNRIQYGSKYDIWDVTARNIKKHKIYKYNPSRYKGIYNDYCECYIISTVQALFMTQDLTRLLRRNSNSKNKVINSLSKIFAKLEQAKTPASINELKMVGPSDFAVSNRQEDAHQYMLGLMDSLEKQMKGTDLLKDFKGLFEIKCNSKIKCLSCRHQTQSSQNQYCHTVSHREKIKLVYEEELQDFSCEKCKNKKTVRYTKLLLPSIFIVHINRFSMTNSGPRKELPTERIPHQLQNHRLVGMVFHIGKNVQCGHYVIYFRVQPKRWLYFNDTSVTEFNVQNQDQAFQKQMKAQHTPYILFYQRQR